MQQKPNQNRPAATHPRKVRGGVKLGRAGAAFPESWIATRLLRIMDQAAASANAAEGLQYARLGQTRHLGVEAGAARAAVQGRSPRAYDTTLTAPPFTEEQWEGVLAAIMEQPVYAARLTSGEVPAALDEMLTRRGVGLLPADSLKPLCTCAEASRTAARWCKHACCVAYLLAERLAGDPFVLFTLRGMSRDELLERLRQRRALAGAGAAGVPVYASHVSGVSDIGAPPLEDLADRFWDAPKPAAGAALDWPLAPPEVSHPLLRRLGPSPFAAADGNGRPPASFPIVGLLATCYDTISGAVIRGVEGAPEPPEAEGTSVGEKPADDGRVDGSDQAH